MDLFSKFLLLEFSIEYYEDFDLFIDFQVKKLALSTQCFKYTTIQGVLFSSFRT